VECKSRTQLKIAFLTGDRTNRHNLQIIQIISKFQQYGLLTMTDISRWLSSAQLTVQLDSGQRHTDNTGISSGWSWPQKIMDWLAA